MSNLSVQQYRTPLVDPATGVITQPWALYFQQLNVRVGGGGAAPSLADLIASIAGVLSDLSQGPPPIPPPDWDDDQAPSGAFFTPERIDPAPSDEALRAEITELKKRIHALEIGRI